MSCVAFVLLKMMLLSHFWAIEENRKVFASLMSHWILRSPFSHRCFSQACTEGGSMAWLAIFAIQNDYFIFPFWVCQGEQNLCCQHLWPGIWDGIFFFFICRQKLTGGQSEESLWIPILCVFSSLCSSCSLSLSLTFQNTWLISRCCSVISASGGLLVLGRICSTLMHFKRCPFSLEFMLWSEGAWLFLKDVRWSETS